MTTQSKTNSIGMHLVVIPAGEFSMGGQEPPERLVGAFTFCTKGPEFFSDEYPAHQVRISRAFLLGRYPVTVGQFRRFVEATGYRSEGETDGTGGWGYNPASGKCEGRDPRYTWRDPGFTQTDDHPVVNVTYADAVAFCAWLSSKEGASYRMPTEAEWEYACRAGTTTRFHNGDDPERLHEVARVMDTTGRTAFGHVQHITMPPEGPFTAPVGSFSPNAWGLYDMHGNVWEWCSDWYHEEYYAHSPADDPRGPAVTTELGVRRGGGWNTFPIYARASFRNYHDLVSRCLNLGFRVVREAGSSASDDFAWCNGK